MVFLWFSYGFPIKTSIFLWFSYGFSSFFSTRNPRSSTEESASAGLAARKRRDKRVTRVATGLLQEPARDGMGWIQRYDIYFIIFQKGWWFNHQ